MFWRMAYRWFGASKPKLFWEVTSYIWAFFFAVIWIPAFVFNPSVGVFVQTLVLVGLPFGTGVALRIIRNAQTDGGSGLYFRQLDHNG
jgi:hypothetical protein